MVLVEALRHRRSLLSHTLLSSRKLKSQIIQANLGVSLTREALDSVKDNIKFTEDTTIANLHRTCSGITAFRVQDPDPNAVDAGNVLGIRFDVFAAEKRAFATPYYVLFNQPNADGQLKIHKHTIPVYVPMQSLIKKYLPFNSSNEDGDASLKATAQQQDLAKFVRALRKELVAHHKRVEAFESLKQGLSKRHGVKEVKMLEVAAKEIEINFTRGLMARVRIAADGKIEKVAVGPTSGNNDDSHDMKAYREVRKAIEGGSGRVDDLVERLKRRS